MKNFKWRPILALILIILIVYFNLTWIWAVLFLFWLIPDLFSGVTFLMEPIEKAKNPILYWAILSTWALLSIFLLFDEFAPSQLLPEWRSSNNMAYQSHKEGDYVLDYKNNTPEEDTLFYKDFISNEFNIVGVSTLTTFKNNEVDAALKELWEVFEKENVAAVISDIIEDNIYVIQSNFDEKKNGYFTLTIGYKTASLEHIYKGLNGVKVKASKYAVVEIEEQPLKKLSTTWEKILLSDLSTSNLNNVEVFHYDSKNKSIEKIDIWLSVPMSKDDLAQIRSLDKQAKAAKDKLSAPRFIKTKKVANPYKFSSPKVAPIVATPELPEDKKYPTQQHQTLTVVGIQKVVNYQKDEHLNKAIEELWTSFFQKNYSKHIYNIIDYEKVYLTYSNYTKNQVTLTLGYATERPKKFNKKKQLQYVSIPSNEYYKFKLSNNQSNHASAEWSVLDEVMDYRAAESCDFEVYTIDKNYKTTNSFLWIGAK